MKKFLTLTLVLFLSLFIVGESSGIRQSQASLIKDLYNKYTNKIGYKDLIIGASSDIIWKYCKRTRSNLIQWRDSGLADYVCYNDTDWGYVFKITDEKIDIITMTSIYIGEPSKKNKNAFRYTNKTVMPLINTLDKRYKIDGSPKIENNYSSKLTRWSFGKGSVELVLSETVNGNLVAIIYQEKYASGSF